MKYMHLSPQSPSRRAVMPFGVDLPATGFGRVFADGPLVCNKHTAVTTCTMHA